MAKPLLCCCTMMIASPGKGGREKGEGQDTVDYLVRKKETRPRLGDLAPNDVMSGLEE